MLLARPALAEPGATGRVVDLEGRPIPGAVVTLIDASGVERVARAGTDGAFAFPPLPAGDYAAVAVASGWMPSGRSVTVRPGPPIRMEVVLDRRAPSETITVIGERIAPTPVIVRAIPGSVDVIDRDTLRRSAVSDPGDALRKVSGVHVRDEEGLGVRPNIGIRGVNPTRSSKVLLLEDGIPLTFAPYGDNASYFHPAIESFDAVEVLKGSGQIAYGPATIGGVVNYLTPEPPVRPSAEMTLLAGDRGYGAGHARVGTTFGRTGVLVSYTHKEGDGARENVALSLDDVHFKLTTALSSRQALTVRASYGTEDSQVTYSGLRLAEYEANPRGNPFAHDRFESERAGASASHAVRLSEHVALTTNLYASRFDRDWWRQSSNSGQRPNDSADPRCGGMANLDTTCGNEGRLRRYTLWGVEPRLRIAHVLLGAEGELEAGIRAHFETQERRQENGETPTAREGVTVEDNRRENDAYAMFLQERLRLGAWTITPGVRVERVGYERLNRLANSGAGASGRTARTEVVPGLGIARSFGEPLTVFAGVHRGFAPPRTEDVIANATGGVVDLDAELSWNTEVGLRALPLPGLAVDATLFRMDYENQVVPASLAGGSGATLTNGGATLHQGVEASARADSGTLLRSLHNVFLRAAYTWVPVAEFRETRTSAIPGSAGVSVTGNRLPYSPEHLLTASVGYEHPGGLTLLVEAVSVGEQFADDLNTRASSADGQRGTIPAYTIWNATVEYEIRALRSALFLTARNLEDETYIVDRTRGILPGNPRIVRAGVRVKL